MQTRPYPEDDGLRVWLSRPEQRALLDVYDGDPKRQLALELGLHGLRSDEIVGGDGRSGVALRDLRQLAVQDNAPDRYKLVIPDGKTGTRETPASHELYQHIRYYANARELRRDDRLIDVTTKTLRNWIGDAREQLAADRDDDGWLHAGMHDLRRTWATDTFYSLAFAGVPIAEELTMSWGGWKMTATGRETFRENYLGPEPDHIAHRAMETLALG